jgi:hypothetical protein
MEYLQPSQSLTANSFISPAASDARSIIQQQTPWRLWIAPDSFKGW